MKHLTLGLSLGYLLFISGKSLVQPVTYQEVLVLLGLLTVLVLEKLVKVGYRVVNKKIELENRKLEASKPKEIDPEIAALQKENDIAALKLRKFMTEQEYNKREIAKAVEKQVGDGGLRF